MCSRSSADSEPAKSVRRTRHSHVAVTVCGDCRNEVDDLRRSIWLHHGGSAPGERSLMSSVEAWFWILLLVLALPAIAAGGALLVRSAVGPDVLARQNNVAGFIYGVIGVVYAVLLGFTAIVVWEQFRN